METQVTISKTERPNSYEFGKAGARVKLYFENAEDLAHQIKALAEIGVPSLE
jgi:hypothetical protein